MNATEELGAALRSARMGKALTQRELAELIGATHTAVSAAELGRHELGAVKFIRWARATGTDLDTLASGIE